MAMHENPRVAALYIDAMAAQARIEAMKAENAHRACTTGGVSYGEDQFMREAENLEAIANALRQL